MGPRSFDRGKDIEALGEEPPDGRFNGAAIFRSRKDQYVDGSHAPEQGFNGAAIFRSRKASHFGVSRCASPRLQWGRDLSIAERLLRSFMSTHLIASMGPRSFDRGKDEVYGVFYGLTGFNGAAIFRSRKARRQVRASNGNGGLQWGRDLSIAESARISGQRLLRRHGFNGAAIFRSRKVAPVRG